MCDDGELGSVCTVAEVSESWKGFVEHYYAFSGRPDNDRDAAFVDLLQTDCEGVAKALQSLFVEIETTLSRNTHAVFELRRPNRCGTLVCVAVPQDDAAHTDRLAAVRG
jgi:hypothetical protein